MNGCGFDCNIFADAKLPPCASFLGSYNPLIKDGKLLYINYNRLFFFLTYNSLSTQNSNYVPKDISTYSFQENANIQISIYDFFIGMFINEIQSGKRNYDKDIKIHDNNEIDKFIKAIIENNYENIFDQFIPSLTYVISNSNAILSLYTGTIQISPINFYIVLMLNRFANDKALLYGNNAYVTPDFINYSLANLFVQCNPY